MRRALFLIIQILFLPHLILFLFHRNKQLIIRDLYSSNPNPESSFKTLYNLTYELAINKYFRTLFYFRTRGIFASVLRVFYPKERYFTIDMHTKIGGGVILAHPYGSIINAESVGDNLYVNQLVTIGENNGKKPVLGNNVKLYTNCSVIGDITIGDNVVVGAGAVVTKSVPDFCTIVGNPARIINTEHIQPPTT